MRLWVAEQLLKLPSGPGTPRLRTPLGSTLRTALGTALRAADAGHPAGQRVVARALASHGADVVWSVWLEPSVSGRSPQRWARLLRWLSAVPDPVAARGPVPDHVVNTAWREWLDRHDADLWSLLKRWARAATGPDPRGRLLSRLALGHEGVTLDRRLHVDTALRFDHPLGAMARARLVALGDRETVDLFCAAVLDLPEPATHPGTQLATHPATAFCVEHRLVPSDDARRAVFFVRTGQHEQYRAQDPDGTLLALGYRGASTAERTALRAAMTSLGDIDALRVLAGQQHTTQGAATLTPQERAFLVRQWAQSRAWTDLWRLVPLLTLTEAVTAVRAFEGWRPAGDEDRRLFTALREADPAVVRHGLGGLSTLPDRLPHTTINLAHRLGTGFTIGELDFSPDGRRLAFSGGFGKVCQVGAVDLGSEEIAPLHSRSRRRDSFWAPVAHLGADAVLFAVPVGSGASMRPMCVDHLDHGAQALPFEVVHIFEVRRVAGDQAFILTAQGDIPVGGSATGNLGYGLFSGAGRGPLVNTGVLRRGDRFFPHRTVTDPAGRLVAVLGSSRVQVLDSITGKRNDLNCGPDPHVPGVTVAALSPTTLVRATMKGDVNVWYDPLTTAEAPVTTQVWPSGRMPQALAFLPGLERFLAVTETHAQLLAVPPPPGSPAPADLVAQRSELAHGDGDPFFETSCARVSPQGTTLAVVLRPSGTVNLYDLTPTPSPLAGPMGTMDGTTLADLTALRHDHALGPSSQQALRLLRGCLEYRFRHDIGLGDAPDAVAASLADTDIALSKTRGAGPGPAASQGGT